MGCVHTSRNKSGSFEVTDGQCHARILAIAKDQRWAAIIEY